MTGANMLCPKCKTFQPAAQVCTNCGIVVAKGWAQQNEKLTTLDEPRRGPAPRTVLYAGVGIVAFCLLGWLGVSLLGRISVPTGLTQARNVLNDALNSQALADEAAQRVEDAVHAAQSGLDVARPSVNGAEATADLDALAKHFNETARSPLVTLTRENFAAVYRQCSADVDRSFPPLRYDSDEDYPFSKPDRRPARDDDLPGTYRCEGARGTTFMEAMPRSRQGIDTCWRRNRPNYSRKKSQREAYWIRMRWDDEANRWAVFTREDKRKVDRGRIRGVRMQLDDRIEDRYKRREKSARARVSTLSAEIDDLRGQLRILNDENTRQDLTARVSSLERRLRQALIDERYTLICKKAANTTLDAKAASL